jgi:hypothetical protein
VDEFHTRSEAEYRDALSRFPYPLTIVSGDNALAEYERLRSLQDGSPIVLGGASEFALAFEFYERALDFEPSTQVVLERAAEMRFPDSYRSIKTREIEVYRLRNPEGFIIDPEDEEFVGEWPNGAIGGSFVLTAARDVVSQEPWPRVHIALIPTTDWTEIPAYLRAGGWNDMPESAVLVAALRSWRDRYGAELVGFAHDSMDIRVRRSPTSREEALALAREHALFCSDALNEFTLRELAANLIENDWWFFWWD